MALPTGCCVCQANARVPSHLPISLPNDAAWITRQAVAGQAPAFPPPAQQCWLKNACCRAAPAFRPAPGRLWQQRRAAAASSLGLARCLGLPPRLQEVEERDACFWRDYHFEMCDFNLTSFRLAALSDRLASLPVTLAVYQCCCNMIPLCKLLRQSGICELCWDNGIAFLHELQQAAGDRCCPASLHERRLAIGLPLHAVAWADSAPPSAPAGLGARTSISGRRAACFQADVPTAPSESCVLGPSHAAHDAAATCPPGSRQRTVQLGRLLLFRNLYPLPAASRLTIGAESRVTGG